MTNDREQPGFAVLPTVEKFHTVLLDLDGTVYLDGDPLPGALSFITRCREAGCRVSFVTNLSLWPKSHCLDALERMGVDATPEQVHTSVDVLMHALDTQVAGRDIGVFAAPHLHEQLFSNGYRVHDLELAPPRRQLDAIVLGQVRDLADQARKNSADAVAGGVPIYATATRGNMATNLQDAFSGVQVLDHIVDGRDAHIIDCGKPSQLFAATINELIGPEDPVLVVGDSLDSDMGLARSNGWSGLLIGARPTAPTVELPDYWAASLEELVR